MEREIVIFFTFGGLAMAFSHIESHLHKRVPRNFVERMVYHENTLHTIRDYGIHFMIYSGYVLGH